ncbi:MAG: hypothetical protein HYT87_11415 [Nitrospirae bacterium]|nr:hypothetical protein [Nitrospirota bacterium]
MRLLLSFLLIAFLQGSCGDVCEDVGLCDKDDDTTAVATTTGTTTTTTSTKTSGGSTSTTTTTKVMTGVEWRCSCTADCALAVDQSTSITECEKQTAASGTVAIVAQSTCTSPSKNVCGSATTRGCVCSCAATSTPC